MPDVAGRHEAALRLTVRSSSPSCRAIPQGTRKPVTRARITVAGAALGAPRPASTASRPECQDRLTRAPRWAVPHAGPPRPGQGRFRRLTTACGTPKYDLYGRALARAYVKGACRRGIPFPAFQVVSSPRAHPSSSATIRSFAATATSSSREITMNTTPPRNRPRRQFSAVAPTCPTGRTGTSPPVAGHLHTIITMQGWRRAANGIGSAYGPGGATPGPDRRHSTVGGPDAEVRAVRAEGAAAGPASPSAPWWASHSWSARSRDTRTIGYFRNAV